MVSKLKPTFITDEFVKAILDSIATGNKITLTTSIGSSTIYTDQQLNGINYQQTQGSSKNITAPLNSAVVKLDTNTIIIELDLTNENLNNDFQIATVLINGKYNGNDLLVGVVRFEAPELFPKYDSTTGSIYEIKSRVYLSLSNISNATIAVSNAGMATAQSVQDLRKYVDGAFNSDIARKSIDNIYNGNNTYNKKIIAPAGLQGNSDSSDKLQTARTIQTNLASTTATIFDGTANVVPGVTGTLPIANGGTGNTNGSAVKLTTARTIGGISFDGTKNIDLPGVNSSGNQDTSGTSSAAKKLSIERKISLTSGASGSAKFDGSSDLAIEVTALDSTLQKAKYVVDNTDLNNLLSSGMYVTDGKQISNTPIAGTSYATIIVIENQNNSKNNSMIYQDTNTNRIWIRQRSASTWKPWAEIFKNGDAYNGDLFVAAPDGKTARIALVNDNLTQNTGLIRYSGLDVTTNAYQGITLLSDNGNLILGGGEGAVELAKALSTGNGLGSLGTYGINANGERTMVGGDGGVIIIPNLSTFQTGVSSTPEDAIFWDFKPNGTVRTPSGNLLQEVDNSTTRAYGLGKLFDPTTYLTFVRSGKVVSVYGNIKTSRDITDLKTYQNENLIPVGYRPFAEFKSTISHNASDGSKKVRGDVAYTGAGNISIDDITIGGSADMNGIVPAGTILTLTATWVML